MVSLAKRLLIGRPIATSEEGHQRLRKRVALPIFASDAMSSTAYATDEILIVLLIQAGVGALAFDRLVPLAIVVAVLLFIVILSYRQTIYAYPSGGGAYIVSKDNLGETAVARRRGVAAHRLHPHRRRVRRRRRARHAVGVRLRQLAARPAVPRHHRRDHDRQPARVARVGRAVRPADVPLHRHARRADRRRPVPRVLPRPRPDPAGRPVRGGARARRRERRRCSLFMLLRAFSSGAVALSGVEAVSNGVQTFRKPESRNAVDDAGDHGSRARAPGSSASRCSRRTSSRTAASTTRPASP